MRLPSCNQLVPWGASDQSAWPKRLAAFLVLTGALGTVACSSPQVEIRREPRLDAVAFAGAQYPAPQAMPAGTPQRAVPPPPGRIARLPPPPGPDSDLAKEVQNAALRDEHTELLLRGYFGVVEALYREFSARRGAEADYDPIPLLRVHSSLAPELEGLHKRAEALYGRYAEMAKQLGVVLDGTQQPEPQDRPASPPGRAEKLRRLAAFTSCAGQDLKARLAHGEVLTAALAKGLGEDYVRKNPPPGEQLARDMGLMMRTLDCSKHAARLMRER